MRKALLCSVAAASLALPVTLRANEPDVDILQEITDYAQEIVVDRLPGSDGDPSYVAKVRSAKVMLAFGLYNKSPLHGSLLGHDKFPVECASFRAVAIKTTKKNDYDEMYANPMRYVVDDITVCAAQGPAPRPSVVTSTKLVACQQ